MSSIYLAARYGRREEMARYADELEALGHDVTSRWVRGSHESPDVTSWECEQWAKEDTKDITRADILVAFTEGPNYVLGVGRGGRHVEYGAALALGKRIVVVGPRENVFHHLPQVRRFPDWPAALAYLEGER